MLISKKRIFTILNITIQILFCKKQFHKLNNIILSWKINQIVFLLGLHLGCGGNGIGGNFIYGIGFVNKGLGGGKFPKLIPPLARGI